MNRGSDDCRKSVRIARVAVPALCAGLVALLAACSTTGPAETKLSGPGSGAVDELDAPTRDLPYPEQTRAVVRVRFDALARAWREIETYAAAARDAPPAKPTGDDRDAPSGESGSDERARRALRAALGGLLTGEHSTLDLQAWFEVASAADGPAAPELSAVAVDRPVVAALSTRGNQTSLRAITSGAPLFEIDDVGLGPSLRIFVPAADGDAGPLYSQLESLCGRDRQQCPSVVRLARHDSWVVLDVELDPVEDLRNERTSETLRDRWSGSEANYFDRKTPAARAFFEPGAAVSIYARASDIPEFAALVGFADAAEGVAAPDAEFPAELVNNGVAAAGNAFGLRDSRTREHEDVALRLGELDSGGWSLEAVATRTPRGREVARASRIDAELPRISTERPLLAFEYAADHDAALDEAFLPELFRHPAEGGLYHVRERLRDTAPWGPYHVAISYPTAFIKTIGTRLARDAETPERSQLAHRNVYAIRAALAARRDADEPGGIAPSGGLALLVDDDYWLLRDLQQRADRLESVLGIAVDASEQPHDHPDRVVVRLAVGDAEDPFGAPSRVSSDLRARLRSSRFPRPNAGPNNSAPTSETTPASSLIRGWRLLRRADQLGLRTSSTERAAGVQLHVGPPNAGSLQLPQSDVSLAADDALPNCLRKTARESRDQLEQMAPSSADFGDVPPEQIAEFTRTIASAREECAGEFPEAASDLRWLRARWLRQKALFEANRGAFQRAHASMKAACEVHPESPCPGADRFRSLAERYRAPRAFPQLDLETTPRDLVFVGPAEPFRAPAVRYSEPPDFPGSGTTSELTDELRPRTPDRRAEWVERLPLKNVPRTGEGSGTVAVVGLDAGLSARLLEQFVELADDYTVPKRIRNERHLRGEPVPGPDVSGLALHIDSIADDYDPALPAVVFWADDTEHSDGPAPVEIELDPAGIALREPAGTVVGGRECYDQTRTICAEDRSETRAVLEKLPGESAGATKRRIERLAEQYRVGELAERLADADSRGGIPAFRLDAAEAIPVGLVARVAGVAAAYTYSHYDRAPAIYLATADRGGDNGT